MIEILIVEDEKPISDLIRLNLMKAGYSCTCAFDGMEAADILEERNFDLIILDVMLPKLNGFELMEYIKPLGIPVIFLTAKATLDDRLRGLTSGAEDYMVKPFEIVELLARVNIELTPKEFELLELLMRNKNITLFREKIYEEIWGSEYSVESRTLDLHIQRLRKKLDIGDCLKTVFKAGYRLEEQKTKDL